MDNIFLGLILFFSTLNVLAFLLMFLDKNKSRKKGAARISEGMLFFLAAAFGSVGVYLGMFAFHHKTRKWYFIIGIPLLMVENIAFLIVMYNFLFSLL